MLEKTGQLVLLLVFITRLSCSLMFVDVRCRNMTPRANIAKFCHRIVAHGDRGSTLRSDAKLLIKGVYCPYVKVGTHLA